MGGKEVGRKEGRKGDNGGAGGSQLLVFFDRDEFF